MDSNNNIHGGNNQILPNATHAIQNIIVTQGSVNDVLCTIRQSDEVACQAQVYDMYYLSTTHPAPVSNEIIRTQELRMCEERLTTDNVLFLTGEEDIGLTTLLAQFAKQHGTNCVSYFNNGKPPLYRMAI